MSFQASAISTPAGAVMTRYGDSPGGAPAATLKKIAGINAFVNQNICPRVRPKFGASRRRWHLARCNPHSAPREHPAPETRRSDKIGAGLFLECLFRQILAPSWIHLFVLLVRIRPGVVASGVRIGKPGLRWVCSCMCRRRRKGEAVAFRPPADCVVVDAEAPAEGVIEDGIELLQTPNDEAKS